MLNTLARFLLIATALAPVIGAVAVNQIARGQHWTHWFGWLAVALLLAVLCWALLRYAAMNAQRQLIHIKEFERKDAEMLAFLLAYLLPFVSSEDLAFTGDWLTSVYIFTVIFLAFAHAGAFHFNPVMGFFKYRFYSIRCANGTSGLLISKVELLRCGVELDTVRIGNGIYLYVKDDGA